MSLREELSDLTNANNSIAFQVESQETHLKRLRTRNAKLKLKSQELETWLKQLIASIEDKNRLKSSLLEIRRDIQARSKSNIASGLKLASLQESIKRSESDLVSKKDELNVLCSNLENLKKWNNVLKHQKEELQKKIISFTTQDLDSIYLEKVKKINDLEVKLLEAKAELQRLNAKIKEASKHSKCLLSYDIKIIKKGVGSQSMPNKFSSSHEGIFKDIQIEHPSNETISKPFGKLVQSIDSEEEIFIVDPPCKPSVVNMQEETSETTVSCFEQLRCKTNLDNCNLVDSEIRFKESSTINKQKYASNTLADITTMVGNIQSNGSPSNFMENSEKSLDSLIVDRLNNESSRCRTINRVNFDATLRPETGEASNADGRHDRRNGPEIDGKCIKRGEKNEARQGMTSPVKVNVPMRRQVSLGDLSNENGVISIGPKRWSHQLELLTHHNSFVVLKPQKRGGLKGNLRKKQSSRTMPPSDKKVRFDPVALLFNAAVEGELGVVKDAIYKIGNIDVRNEEGMTALHYAIFAEHFHIVTFLVEEGCDVNVPDLDGWTPLHCAASCNDVKICEFLIENGASVFASSFDDLELPSDKCDETEEGFRETCDYLIRIEKDLGLSNNGVVYALYDFKSEGHDELSFKMGDCLIILRKGDSREEEWWWGCLEGMEGYIPRNLIGLYPRII